MDDRPATPRAASPREVKPARRGEPRPGAAPRKRARRPKKARRPAKRPQGVPRQEPAVTQTPSPSASTSYDLLSVLARVLADVRNFALPTVARGFRRALFGVRGTARSIGHAVWGERARIGAICTRVLWWAALALLLLVGNDLLAGRADGPWVEGAAVWFAVGAGACVLVTVAARPRHLRVAGAMLGVGHGAFALLSYVATTTLS